MWLLFEFYLSTDIDNIKITCPVTVLCGEKDRANLKASKKLNELLSQATLQIVSGAGHEINKDAPEVIAAILNM